MDNLKVELSKEQVRIIKDMLLSKIDINKSIIENISNRKMYYFMYDDVELYYLSISSREKEIKEFEQIYNNF